MIITRVRVLHSNGTDASSLLTQLRLAATDDCLIEHVSARAGPDGADVGVFTNSNLGLAATAAAHNFVERVLVMSPHLGDCRVATSNLRTAS